MPWVVALIALDLWSKSAAFAWLHGADLAYDGHGHGRIELVGEWFAFMASLNPGMAWGFDKLPPHVLVGGRVVAAVVLTVLLLRTAASKRALVFALVLILAGALGNLHDNLLTEAPGRPFGMVRDFIDVYFAAFDWHFPTFNVADSCITVGAILLLASGFFGEGEAKRETLPLDK